MYALSQAAAQDLEEILDRSIVDFGPNQTGWTRLASAETDVVLPDGVIAVPATSRSRPPYSVA